MYSEQQAKNGFKTFVVTLSISLMLFGALYYVITDLSSDIDIESSTVMVEDTLSYNTPEVKGTTDTSVFGNLVETRVDTSTGTVLATTATTEEVTEATTAPVPDTGSEQIVGIILALSSFAAVSYFLLAGPRNLALLGFEKETVKNLEK